MKFEMLKSFITLVEQRSYSKAAEMCFISQSALSRQILELESITGMALIHRTTRSVSVTVAGREFYQFAKKTLEEWENTKERMQKTAAKQFKEICIGYTLSPQVPLIMEGVQQNTWLKKGIEIKLKKLSEESAFMEINNGLLDCAVMNKPFDGVVPGINYMKLFEGGVSLVVSENSPLAKYDSIRKEQLKGYSLVSTPVEAYPKYFKAIYDSLLSPETPKLDHLIVKEPEEVPVILGNPRYVSIWPSIYPLWKGLKSLKIRDLMLQLEFIMVFAERSTNPFIAPLAEEIRRSMHKNGKNAMVL